MSTRLSESCTTQLISAQGKLCCLIAALCSSCQHWILHCRWDYILTNRRASTSATDQRRFITLPLSAGQDTATVRGLGILTSGPCAHPIARLLHASRTRPPQT